MSLASLFSGLALANAGLGAVHGIAGPLGGMIEGAHGALCARLLPMVVETNLAALTRDGAGGNVKERYAEASRMVLGSSRATASDLAAWLHRLVSALEIPPLSRWGLTADKVPALVAKSRAASSMRGNPVRLTDAELTAVIEQAL